MAASTYIRQMSFFQTVTLMASCFANNAWWEFYNLPLGQSAQDFQTLQAVQDKGFVRDIFPRGNWRLQLPH